MDEARQTYYGEEKPPKSNATRWTEEEIRIFEELLPKYGNNWKNYVPHFKNRDRNKIKCFYMNHKDKY